MTCLGIIARSEQFQRVLGDEVRKVRRQELAYVSAVRGSLGWVEGQGVELSVIMAGLVGKYIVKHGGAEPEPIGVSRLVDRLVSRHGLIRLHYGTVGVSRMQSIDTASSSKGGPQNGDHPVR